MADELSPKKRSALERAIKHPELQIILFSKAEGLVWFDAFESSGFLNPELVPPPKEVEKGYFQIPSWPITEYLVKCSPLLKEPDNLDYAKKTWAFINLSTQYAKKNGFGNYRAWRQFSKIIRNLPLEVMKDEYYEVVSYWLLDQFESGLTGDEIVKWFMNLIDNSGALELQYAYSLLSLIYNLEVVDKKYSDEGRKEAAVTFKSYHFDTNCVVLATKAGSVLGEPSVAFFVGKMEEVLGIDVSDNLSPLWRRAVEEHEQNYGLEGTDNIVLAGLRDALIGFCSMADQEDVNRKIAELLQNPYETIRRVAIYVAGINFSKLSEYVIAIILERRHLKDYYRHEIWEFLNQNYQKLSENQKRRLLKDVQEAVVVTEEDGTRSEKKTAYQQMLWLSSIKDYGSEEGKLYEQHRQLIGIEPDHPDFSVYSSSGWVTHESPIDIVELVKLAGDVKALVAYLNNYEYQGVFDEPGLEGLVDTFGEFVKSNKKLVLENFEYFLELKPHYLEKLFGAFEASWSSKDDLDWKVAWPVLLESIYRLYSGELFWSYPPEAPGGAFIGNVFWVIGTISRLMESGCKKDDHSFGIDNVPKAKLILELILQKIGGEQFEEQDDAVLIAINSPRGKALEAYINLCLYHLRNIPEDQRKQISNDYLQVFDAELKKADEKVPQFEFATLVAMYFVNFLFISNKWILGNLEKVFNINNKQRWLCAIQGYSYIGNFIPEVYQHFKNNGMFIAILDSEILKRRVEDKYIQFITIAYYRKLDSLQEEGSLIARLLNRNYYEEISQLISFVWHSRNIDSEARFKEMVYELFPRLLEIIDYDDKEGRKLASRLCFWTGFIEELKGEPKGWLLSIAPHSNEEYNTNYLLEGLAELSDHYPFEVVEVWSEMLKNSSYDYPEEAFKRIFSNLIAQGKAGERAAKSITDLYLKHGMLRPSDWLKEVANEGENV